MDYSEEPDDFVYYGNSLEPFEEEDLPAKKPIRIEDQIVTDENGRRRFHGAFTGGFSAGYYNSVGSKEGWRPSEFKSSRSNRGKFDQKPEDFMDEEDKGAFGFAPQKLRAKEDFGDNQVSRKRRHPVFTSGGAIPGIPVLHDLLRPSKETIGIKLLRAMGWKPSHGIGERLTKKEKLKKQEKLKHLRSFGCELPPQFAAEHEDIEGDEDVDQLLAPDDTPTFVVQPKDNVFGLGYSGLIPRGMTTDKRKYGKVFEPTLSLTDKRKKLKIAGQAFGVGAFEDEDEDIYAKDDMSQYDFELGGKRETKSKSNLLCLPSSDVIDGFVRSTKPEPIPKVFLPPSLPKDFIPVHRNSKSRFDILPPKESDFRGLGRHELNAFQRAAFLHEVLDIASEPSHTVSITQPVKIEPVVPIKVAEQTTMQPTVPIPSPVTQPALPAPATSKSVHDPDKEYKIKLLKEFLQASVAKKATGFQPFSKDQEKQFRFDSFSVLSKAGRLQEFQLLQPESMTEWEKEREKVEFERALALYRPLSSNMQNRFTSGGQIEENIEGGLVAEISSIKTEEKAEKPKPILEKDPAKRAAKLKQFGSLTRQRREWKPDRILCIRFNVPNPYPDSNDQKTNKAAPKRFGEKFSIFDVLNVVPQSVDSSITEVSQQMKNIDTVQSQEIKQLEWDKAERGELLESVEAEQIKDTTEIEMTDEIKEEDVQVYQRPPMDLFKAIFEQSETEDEEEEDEKEKMEQNSQKVEDKKIDTVIPKFQVDQEEDEERGHAYGPRLPSITKELPRFESNPISLDDDEEWVEKGLDNVAKSHKKKKKDKKSKQKKQKKDKKTKKKKRHRTSSSSSMSSDDSEIIKRIVALKKKHKL